MNILLWVLQIALAIFYVAGGGYKLSKADELVKQTHSLAPGAWRVLGVIEILGGILLVVPASVTGMPDLIPIAAGVLVVEGLFLAWLFGRRSVKLVAANPFVWAAGMTVLVAVVAFGRYALA